MNDRIHPENVVGVVVEDTRNDDVALVMIGFPYRLPPIIMHVEYKGEIVSQLPFDIDFEYAIAVAHSSHHSRGAMN